MSSEIFHFLKRFRQRVLPPSREMVFRQFEATRIELNSLRTEFKETMQFGCTALQMELNSLDKEFAGLKSVVTFQMLQGRQDSLVEILRFLEPRTVLNHTKIRVGRHNDGGYILLNDFSGLSHAFSFGIANDDSWDRGIADLGISVEQFDPTIDHAPSSHPLLHFHKKRISGNPGPECETLQALIELHSKKSIPDIVVKIDIEGGEWEVFDQTPRESLQKCAQIVCEFHTLGQLRIPQFSAVVQRVLCKLAQDFDVIHVHGNNFTPWVNLANLPIPDTLEVSYVNKSIYETVVSCETFPTTLDMPNDANFPDMYLGAFRF